MNPENLRAMLFMVLGMGLFASEDLFIKRATNDMPVIQVLFVLSLGGAAIFAALCVVRRVPLVSRDLALPTVATRNMSEVIATLCYVIALSLIPLSLASAILQATPIFATAGATLVLGETVGWRRWTAVLVGMAGVLLILRPGLDGFRPAAVLALIAAICLATRDIASRRIPRRIETVQLSFWAYGALTVVTGAIVSAQGFDLGLPPTDWINVALATLLGVCGYAALTTATRLGDVSAVIPFRYTRLVFALILGVALLKERPDALTLTGAAIVVGAGLYAIWRERQLRRPVPIRRKAG